jgi:hypothetical protein
MARRNKEVAGATRRPEKNAVARWPAVLQLVLPTSFESVDDRLRPRPLSPVHADRVWVYPDGGVLQLIAVAHFDSVFGQG